VYVTLRYCACPTDERPIPGEPCRTEDDMLQASRWTDDFTLELSLDPPAQREEAAVRDFVDWLRRIPVVDGPSSVKPEAFADAVRAAAFAVASPPDFMYGAPPATLRVGRDDAWATDLRPSWAAAWWAAQERCADGRPVEQPQPENVVLLARLGLPIVRNLLPGQAPWQLKALDFSDPRKYVDEDLRPFLVPVRMLQEWLWCGSKCGASSMGEVLAVGRIKVGADPVGPAKLAAAASQAVKGGVLVTFDDPWRSADFGYAVLTQTVGNGVVKNPRIDFMSSDEKGILLCVADATGKFPKPDDLKGFEFLIHVTRYRL
jgi:hypothetical protein